MTPDMEQKTRNYNHNVDIRSTQITDIGRTIVKGSVVLARKTGLLGLASAGFCITCGVLIWTGFTLQDMADKSRGVKTLNFSELHADVIQNEVRASDIWKNRYLRFTGNATQISEGRIEVRKDTYKVFCILSHNQREALKRLDKGDQITVAGKNLWVRKSYGIWATVTLKNCEIN